MGRCDSVLYVPLCSLASHQEPRDRAAKVQGPTPRASLVHYVIHCISQDDVARLRIVSLQDVDLEALMEQSSAVEPKKEEPGAQL